MPSPSSSTPGGVTEHPEVTDVSEVLVDRSAVESPAQDPTLLVLDDDLEVSVEVPVVWRPNAPAIDCPE